MYEELTESEAQNYITDFVETAHELAKSIMKDKQIRQA